MKNLEVLCKCPVCQDDLMVSELHCSTCQTQIRGQFRLSPFDRLSKQQQEFALIFLKNEGNIKLIEKELKISYPTVKKQIDQLLQDLNLKREHQEFTREQILDLLKQDKISFEEASELLNEIER